MTIMRAVSALNLLLLSGCAAAARQTEEPLLRVQPEILHVNGTVEPVAFTLDGDGIIARAEPRQPCQTNDPMPTGSFTTPPPKMLNVRPLRVAPMPNYCPVAAPTRTRSVITTAPRPPKGVPAPLPTEPQP